MSILATDDFAGTQDPLSTPWITITGDGQWKKAGAGVAEPEEILLDSGVRYGAITWPDDQWAQCKCSVDGTDDQAGPGVALRIAAAERTFYRITVCKASSLNISVSKFLAGVLTLLGQMTASWTNGDILYADVEGAAPGTLTVKQNGTLIDIVAGDAAIESGDAGIAYSSTTTSASVDDWSGGLLEAPTEELIAGPQRTVHEAISQRETR